MFRQSAIEINLISLQEYKVFFLAKSKCYKITKGTTIIKLLVPFACRIPVLSIIRVSPMGIISATMISTPIHL